MPSSQTIYKNYRLSARLQTIQYNNTEIQDSLVQNDIYGVCSDDDESVLESVYQDLLDSAESATLK